MASTIIKGIPEVQGRQMGKRFGRIVCAALRKAHKQRNNSINPQDSTEMRVAK